MKSRFRSNAVTKEETEDTLLRAMLYEPFPGNAAVVLSRLGFLGKGLVDGVGAGLGSRTFDAESGRLSLTMDDGRVVELERALHPHIENRYAVSVQSPEGVVVDRGFILIDRDSGGKDVGVTDLLNYRMAYAEAEGGTHETEVFSGGGVDFEPSAEEEVRVEEAETIEEPVMVEEVLPVVAEEQIQGLAEDEPVEEKMAEGLTLPHGDGPCEVEEAGPDVQSSDCQIDRELEIAVEAEEAGIDAEPETFEVQETVIEAAPDVESGAGQIDSEPEIAVEAEEAGGEDEPVEVLEASIEAEPEPMEVEPVEVQGAVVETEREAATGIAEPEVEVASAPEVVRKVSDRERYYGPLFQALEANEAVLFGWVAETGTIQTYEHKETGRYLHLDGASGLFYDQRRTPISKSAALRHAIRPLVLVETTLVADEEAVTVAVPAAAAGPASGATVPMRPQVENEGHGGELGLDAFMRKAEEPVAREGGRESWKSRFAGLSRALKLKRNQNGHEGVKESVDDEKGEG